MLVVAHLPELKIATISFSDIRPKIEKYLHMAAAGVVTFVLILSLAHGISARFAPAPGTITVRVHPGENLWTYAQRYGNPDTYILKRVQNIARMNNLQANRPLQVGQELVVPVERPEMTAQVRTSVE